MGQLNRYRLLVKNALNDYATLLLAPPEPDYEVVVICDDKSDQYLLRRIGWTKNKRVNYTDLHITIRNNKIWIEEDWTEEGIATYFLEHGVRSEDIVLGFQPPQMRQYTEFAVA